MARRLTQPFVTWSLLVAEFSELAAEVASKYFTETPAGRYAFRPAYARSASFGSARATYALRTGLPLHHLTGCQWSKCQWAVESHW